MSPAPLYDQIGNGYDGTLNAYFPECMTRSTEVMPTSNALMRLVAESGFSVVHHEPYAIRSDLQDGFLYSGKHDPARYLNEAFRSGISTFAAVASVQEVLDGCRQLADDIATGHFEQVASTFANDGGDYTIWLLEAS